MTDGAGLTGDSMVDLVREAAAVRLFGSRNAMLALVIYAYLLPLSLNDTRQTRYGRRLARSPRCSPSWLSNC